jgi:CheY-like chemotaxis protein
MEISVEPFDLRETMGLAEQLFLPGCEQKGVKFEAHVDEAVPGMLAGDKSRLLQVLNNLIGNAVKFTEEGSIRVSAASLPATPDGRPRVLFSVEDTGIGIRDEDLSSLFEPFTQADGGYRRKYQGAGLGLSIVRRLVELMGGSMAVAGEPGVGAEFHFCLPFDTVSGPGEEAGGLRKVCAGGRNLCVLVVEDDVVNRMVMQRLLEKNECEVGVAENGERALEKLRDRHFDAVLMDVQMPVMDGVEATRAIREGGAGEDRSGIPIIALTAYAMSGDREKFLDSGMNGYLAKPVEETDLRVELERVVNGVEPGGAGPE